MADGYFFGGIAREISSLMAVAGSVRSGAIIRLLSTTMTVPSDSRRAVQAVSVGETYDFGVQSAGTASAAL